MSEKYNLKEVTFIIPFFYDSVEREENLICIVNYLRKHFDTNIFILEGYINRPSYFIFQLAYSENGLKYQCSKKWFVDGMFHRTKVLNEGIRDSSTQYIVIYDADVILEPHQYIKSLELLKSGVTIVYPYDGKWIDINRSYIQDDVIRPFNYSSTSSVGGACFINKEKYIECGMENENFINYGYEDQERISRFQKIGLHIYRLDGNLVHLKHYRGPNSNLNNDCSSKNEQEFKKIENMSTEEVLTYVRGWKWLEN